MDALEALFLLGVGAYLGVKVYERYQEAFPPGELHPFRSAQVECRCEHCAPPFLQESPPEVQ